MEKQYVKFPGASCWIFFLVTLTLMVLSCVARDSPRIVGIVSKGFMNGCRWNKRGDLGCNFASKQTKEGSSEHEAS